MAARESSFRWPRRTKVVGVTFDNDDGSSRQKIIRTHCRAGMALELIHEPNNPHGGNAIGVWIYVGRRRFQLGYLSSELAYDLIEEIEGGRGLRGTILAVTGGGEGLSYGVNIEIQQGKGTASERRGCRLLSGRGCVWVVGAFGCLAIWSNWHGAKQPSPAPRPVVPRARPSAPIPTPAPIISPAVEAPAPREEELVAEPPARRAPVKPAGPQRSVRAATMLRSSASLEFHGKFPGAISSYRDVIIKFPGTPEAKEAAVRLKALGGAVPTAREYKPVE